MGRRNFVIEGVSGAGKTTVCDELVRRGYHAVHGDRELRPPKTHALHCLNPEDAPRHEAELVALVHKNAIWDKAKVLRHIENSGVDISFFCGGFRNHVDLMGLFDGAFVLEVDAGTLARRLSTRPTDEFGGRPLEQTLIMKLHATKEDMPKGAISIDATRPIEEVADQIIRLSDEKFWR
ncbi:MAG: AAA family ATPase [Pseudomonadota bacterium]